MNKYLLLLFIPLLTFALSGCDDADEDFAPMDIDLLAGSWIVVSSDDERDCVYEITMAPDHTEGTYGGYYGTIATYYLSVSGNAIYDKEYNWIIREVENNKPLLTLTYQADIDGDDPWAGNYYYKIIKLTDTYMWWQGNTNGDNRIIKFRRLE